MALKRGKPAKEVLAARIRMTVVPAITARYMMPCPSNTVRAICEMTVSVSEGTAPISRARKEMPMNSEPRINAIQIRVIPALRLRGSLKAVIPLEIASTPVSAAVPLEKACNRRNAVIPDIASPKCSTSGGSITSGSEPVSSRNNPVPMVRNIIAIKKKLGMANAAPDSLTPRRLITVINMTHTMAMATR